MGEGFLVMGVDPGYRCTGYGMISHDGERSRCVYRGQLELGDEELAARLHRIFEHTRRLLTQYRPDVLVVEEVFLVRNPSIALKLGHARAAVILAAADANVVLAEYATRAVKKALTGRGSADKDQVAYMVCQLLDMEDAPGADVADALGLALCHAQGARARDVLSRACRQL